MELLYLLIEDCDRLGKHKEVSLSGKYTFSISQYSLDKRELVINITEPSSYPSDFFPGNILNVNGIIGENGTGKTSFFEFLIKLLNNQTLIREKFLAIFKHGGDFKIFHTLYDLSDDDENMNQIVTNEWSVKVYFYSYEIEITTLKVHSIDPLSPTLDSINALKHTLLIYYSGIFDLKGYPKYLYDKHIDVSTNKMISGDVEQERYSMPDKDFLYIYKSKNTLRQFKLVVSGLLERTDFKIPDITTVSFTRVETSDVLQSRDISPQDIEIFKYFYDTIETKEFLKVNNNISNARENADKEVLSVYYRSKYKLSFVDAIIAHFFRNIDRGEYYGNWSKVNIEKLKNLDIIEAFLHFFKFQEIIDKEPVILFIENFISLIDDPESEVGENENVLHVSKTERIAELISTYEDYLKSFTLIDEPYGFIEIDWRDMSSGEKAFLDLYSRLHYAKELAQSKPQFREIERISTVYLLLDEAEIGFHPEWQRNYINSLYKFLSYLFYDEGLFQNTNVQVIIASHSPFVASDLPKSNLIFLEKIQDSIFNVCSFDKEQTFGANIHYLLSDTFFLQKGLIGEFAKIKIFELMQEIENLEDPDEKTVENYKRYIEIIGEPMIRQKLYEILLSKYSTSDNTRRREYLQKEMDKLEGQNNKE